MLILKVYSVLDTLALEISCYHAGDPDASHLLIRESTQGPTPTLEAALRRVASVCELEASLLAAGSAQEDRRCVEVL